jgi:Domain of Unknown Function with PDB structure (DUF3857)/Transglutaminase-like superfamily
MLKALITTTAIFIFTKSFSQEKMSEKFGNFDKNLITQKIFSIDSSAESITLYEKYRAEFTYNENMGGFVIINYFHFRKKILKTSALDQAVIIIPYYWGSGQNREMVDGIKGATYNSEGKSDLDKKSIFEEVVTSEKRQKKITLPNVKEGSIIEYQYTIQTPLTVDNDPRTWTFQGKNPTLWSEMEVTIPDIFHYKLDHSGYLGLDISQREPANISFNFSTGNNSQSVNGKTDETAVRHRYVVKNAPAFINEPFITDPIDYVSKISFDLSSINMVSYSKTFSNTWQDIDKTLTESKNWGEKLKKNNYLKELVAEMNKITEPKERLKKAYNYMIQNYKWDEYSGVWIGEEPKKVFDKKTGSASELNCIMIALLRELKFETDPVVLSTRSHGRLNTMNPQLENLNYTIARTIVGSDTLLIDVTDPFIPMGSLPQHCINEVGRVIKAEGESEFIEIKPIEKYAEYENFYFKYDKDFKKVLGRYSNSSSGYAGHDSRVEIKKAGDESYKKDLKASFKELTISNIKLENETDPDKILITSFDYEKENDGDNTDRLYIDPFLFGKMEKNPFTKAKREFPINFGHATNQISVSNIEIPEGYEIEEMPKNGTVALPDNGGRFSYLSLITGNKIQIQSKIQLNKPIYMADEYEYLSELYNRIIQKHAEQIVLKKN